MTQVAGFRFSAVAAGIKKTGALDLALIACDEPAVAAGVFTRNLVRAAPVEVAQHRIAGGRVRAILVNSGNANACTGEPGLRATLDTTAAVARALGVEPDLVIPASTGVIGAVLPSEKVVAAVPQLVEKLSADNADLFAQGILTTDRWKKVSTVTLEQGGERATFHGMAKGAGMIHPDLGPKVPHATLLAFVVTDATVDAHTLQKALERAAELTFNACSVDGDTSTNDTLVVLASGKSKVRPTEEQLISALVDVCRPLARELVRDGEGAEHAVDIVVRGLDSEASAKQVAKTIATSPLVKTALYGKDANWGRLLAAAGRAGIAFDPKRATISIGGHCICERGLPTGKEAEERANAVMKQNAYAIEIELGDGPGHFTYVTSDFGHAYVDVNAGYRS